MSLRRVSLESFDEEELSQHQESADFLRGYEVAMLAAQEAAEAASAKALEEFTSTLSDMEFGFEEARAYLSKRLHHLLIQVAEKALPSVLLESFGAYLHEMIEAHFSDLTNQPVQIATTPDVAAAFSIEQACTSSRFQFIADPDLSAGQAVLRDGDTHVMLNLPALLEALQSTLSSFETFERKELHG